MASYSSSFSLSVPEWHVQYAWQWTRHSTDSFAAKSFDLCREAFQFRSHLIHRIRFDAALQHIRVEHLVWRRAMQRRRWSRGRYLTSRAIRSAWLFYLASWRRFDCWHRSGQRTTRTSVILLMNAYHLHLTQPFLFEVRFESVDFVPKFDHFFFLWNRWRDPWKFACHSSYLLLTHELLSPKGLFQRCHVPFFPFMVAKKDVLNSLTRPTYSSKLSVSTCWLW